MLRQWRNKKVFSNIDVPKNGKTIILHYVQDIIHMSNNYGNSGNLSKKKEMLIGWDKPREGFIKLNTDGYSKSNSVKVSAGGFLRNKEGRWINGFMANISQYDSLMAEIWAAIFGLEMAWNGGFKKIILEVDSLVLTKMMKEQVQQRKFVPMLYHIAKLLNHD